MVKLYTSILFMCFSTFTYAENTSINFTTGVWKVVKLEPEANNPLKYTDTYMIFLENGILLNVEASKNMHSPCQSVTSKFTKCPVKSPSLLNGGPVSD